MSRRVSVYITENPAGVSVRDIINDMEDGAKPPSFKITSRLETTLGKAFAHTQAQTHIITGSLKASGHTASDFDGNMWTGTISYGGPLFGTPVPGPPNDPVDYAIYERARGGTHDFFAGLDAYEQEVEEVVNEFFPG